MVFFFWWELAVFKSSCGLIRCILICVLFEAIFCARVIVYGPLTVLWNCVDISYCVALPFEASHF